jgi:endonuclease YncB( thermonuclease family)
MPRCIPEIVSRVVTVWRSAVASVDFISLTGRNQIVANQIIATAVATLLTAVVSLTPATAAQAPARGTGSIDLTGSVRVVDGDTLDVEIDGHRAAVGLIGIKAPMANTDCGKTAAAFLQELAVGRLRLEEDLAQSFDTRKRRMYYLRLENGASAAVELARAGLVLPDGKGIEAEEIAAAARAATSTHLGCVVPAVAR